MDIIVYIIDIPRCILIIIKTTVIKKELKKYMQSFKKSSPNHESKEQNRRSADMCSSVYILGDKCKHM